MKIKDIIIESMESLVGDNGEVIEYKGGFIDINFNPTYAPRGQSVVGFLVPEASRNQGIGDMLVKMAIKKFPDLGAQISSLPSLKVFYNNGFRNPEIPNGTFEDHVSAWNDNWGSLFLAKNDADGKSY